MLPPGGGGGGGRITPPGGGESDKPIGGGGNCEGRVGKLSGIYILFIPLSGILVPLLAGFLSNSKRDISNLLTFIVLCSSIRDIFATSVFI
jgi:hypothetical protein